MIETPKEFTKKETRLKEINDDLEKISQEDGSPDIEKVVKLRDEAKEIAKELLFYLDEVFEVKKK